MVSKMVFCRRFIGRDAELQLLADRWRAATNGRGSLVLVAGDAGIGKTRFLGEVRKALEADGARFALGQCLQHTPSPLGPIVEALHELHAADPALLESVPHLRLALTRVLPELERPEDRIPASDDRRGLYEAIAAALLRFAERRPTIVAIEDAQWADLTSLEFLHYAAERIMRSKLVLVVTYRSDELNARHPLTAALAKLARRGAWQLQLAPLSESEMRLFVADALDGRAALPADRIRHLLTISEGSPLFAEELLRHEIEAEASANGAGELPLSIRSVVLERIATLDAEDRMALSYAAVIGRRFDAALLAELTGRPVDAIAGLLRTARDLQLIRELRDGRDAYVFRHAVIQEALYEELLWSEARPLHERIGRKLEALEPDDERVVELAHHWWAAREPERAARYSIAAGDFAVRRLAHHDAVRFYERALEFVPPESEAQALLYEKLGKALNATNPGPRSLRAFEHSLSYYEQIGDRERIVEISLEVGRQYWQLSLPEERRRACERALQTMASAPEHPLYFAALTDSLCQHALAGDVDGAQHDIDMVARFRGTPAPNWESRFAMFRAMTDAYCGRVRAVHDGYHRAIALASTVGDLHALPLAWCNYGCCVNLNGEIDVARSALETSLVQTRERFLSSREAYAIAYLARVELTAGNLARAREYVAEAESLAATSELPWVHVELTGTALRLAVLLDDRALLGRFLRTDLIETAFRSGESQRIGPIALAFAEVYEEQGEAERARSLVARAAGSVFSIADSPELAFAIAKSGSDEHARRIRTLLERWAAPEESRLGRGCLALFDAIAGRRHGATLQDAERAARCFRAMGLLRYEALALETAGRDEEALAIHRRTGNVRDVRRLEARVTPVNRRGRAKNELTARERQIARLVADGRSNRSIAESLVLSERTVESHVASILAKLEASSRAEIAARRAIGEPAIGE
jgi:DNA-binding CsgD family transcriptional regulator/tetratricopeptide (TPR) repeat protein